MSCNSDYTQGEWRDILLLTVYTIALKAKEARTTFSMTKIPAFIKEAISLQNFLTAGQKKYPENELINDLVSCLKISDDAKDRNKFTEDLPQLEELVENVNRYLAEKSDETEASEYRAFVYELAYEICKSAGGGFFGISENVDATEAEFLHNLKSCLLADS